MKIGLDIDGVLCNFVGGVIKEGRKRGRGEYFSVEWHEITAWNFAPYEQWKDIIKEESFWANLDPLPNCQPLPFTPDCYITARWMNTDITKSWLGRHGFPDAEVITVQHPFDKLGHIQRRELDVFVDDHWETVRHLREAGVNAILYSAPYQRGHDIEGLPKIDLLSEVLTYVGPKELPRNGE